MSVLADRLRFDLSSIGGPDVVDRWIADHVADPPAKLFFSLCCRLGRAAGPWLLDEWWSRGDLDLAALRTAVLDVWSSAEFPEPALGRRRWLELFTATGFVSDGPPRPVEPMTVYRGAVARRMRGMAWTTDRGLAERFGHIDGKGFLGRFPGVLWQATIPPRAVLAMIGDGDGRGESEVIVNPNTLRGSAAPEQLISGGTK